MGTTLSAVMLIQDRAVICQVGDSRVYRLRNGELSQVTTDHSWVEESVAAGMMSREEAEKHPYRNMLTRAIGAEEAPVTPDIIEEPIEEGDLFLLCSDGLMAHVEDDQIRQVLEENAPSRASWKLVQAALAGGGSDNVTVLIARVDALESV
jgi:protein phosphatase